MPTIFVDKNGDGEQHRKSHMSSKNFMSLYKKNFSIIIYDAKSKYCELLNVPKANTNQDQRVFAFSNIPLEWF